MPPYEFDPNAPIYLQIIGEIKKRSVRGVYSPGSKLPSVRDMAREMDVNPNTMARAYAELEREGFILMRRGQGSFVTEQGWKIDSEKWKVAHGAVARFVADIRELGLDSEQIVDLLRDVKDNLNIKEDLT